MASAEFMKKNYCTFLVIIAGIFWGIISIFVRRLTSEGFSSLQICCIRAIVSVIIMAVWFLIKDRSLFRIQLKDIWIFIGTGILSLSFFSYCYFTTIISSGAAIAVVLLYTSPVFVMLMGAAFFKERFTKRKLFALILTLSGCFLTAGIVGSETSISVMGLLTGLGSGFGYALYSIFAGFATRKKYSSLTITFYTLLFSGTSLLLLCKPKDMASFVRHDTLIYMVGVALICTVIPYVAYTAGLAGMETGRAAVLVTVEPLVGTLLGIFAYRESVDALKIIGIVLTFISVVILALKEKENG